MSGRVRAEYESLVGHFVNIVVVRSTVSPGRTFVDHLAQVWRDIREAVQHQEYPMDQLKRRLGPAWFAGHAPMYQVGLNLVKTHVGNPMTDFDRRRSANEPVFWGPLKIEPYPIELIDADHPALAMAHELVLRLIDSGGSLMADIQYDSHMFDLETIKRFERGFMALLEDAVEQPELPLHRLKILDDCERQRLVNGTNASDGPLPEATLPHLFEAQVRRTSEAMAVVCGDFSLSYAELNKRANRLAHHLNTLGVGPEILVGVCLERSAEMVVALLAILKSGGAYLPLDPEYPEARLAHMLADARPALVLCSTGLRGRLPAAAPVLELNAAETERTLGRSAEHDPSDSERPAPLLPAHAAYVIYTSGSTGTPKGVIVTHQNVVRLFGATARWFDFGPQDVSTLFHSYAFDFSVWELWGALLYGGRLVVVPKMVARSPRDMLELLVRERVTLFCQTPSAFYQLMQADAQDPELSRQLCLRQIVFGGEALDLSRLEDWYRRHESARTQLINMYGITETTVHVSYLALEQDLAAAALGSYIGGNIPDLRVYVLDAWLELVPVGVTGEMYVAGAGLARGYLGRPGLTAERFVADPYNKEQGARMYRTGDQARWRSDGTLEYLGRSDHQVKIRGFRIELGEIEAALREHTAVADAAVVVRETAGSDKQLVGYVVARPGLAPDLTALRGHLAGSLPSYMVPAAFVLIPCLPLDFSGKLDRRALPAPDAAAFASGGTYVAPRTATEALMAAIWSEVLERPQVGINDDFFELGGHSLMAFRLFSLIRERFQKDLPVANLFVRPTIALLSELLDESPAISPAEGAPASKPARPARFERVLTRLARFRRQK